MIEMWSLFCEECLKIWSSTVRDHECPFCGSDAVASREDEEE